MSKVRTIKQIEKEIEVLIEEGKSLANETGENFNVLVNTFFTGTNIVRMCDENDADYSYLNEWYAKKYGESGTWF